MNSSSCVKSVDCSFLKKSRQNNKCWSYLQLFIWIPETPLEYVRCLQLSGQLSEWKDKCLSFCFHALYQTSYLIQPVHPGTHALEHTEALGEIQHPKQQSASLQSWARRTHIITVRQIWREKNAALLRTSSDSSCSHNKVFSWQVISYNRSFHPAHFASLNWHYSPGSFSRIKLAFHRQSRGSADQH